MTNHQQELADPRSDTMQNAIVGMAISGEKIERDYAMKAYVDMGFLARLDSPQAQYVDGRRGAGKTHLFTYFTERVNSSVRERGDVAIYIDGRDLRYESGPLSGPPRLIGQRLFREFCRRLSAELRGLSERVLFQNNIPVHRTEWDELVASESQRLVTQFERLSLEGSPRPSGSKKSVQKQTLTSEVNADASGGIVASLTSAAADIKAALSSHRGDRAVNELTQEFEYSMPYGDLRRCLEEFLKINDLKRLFVLVDEWTSIQYEAQPFFADYLKRCILPSSSLVLKIATIPFQTNFALPVEGGIVGFERNGDIFQALDLDAEMVFVKNRDSIKRNFEQILRKHLAYTTERRVNPIDMLPDSKDYVAIDPDSIALPVTNDAHERMLLFAQGNPRDYLNLFRKSYLKWLPTDSVKINIVQLDEAAKDFGSEKIETIKDNASGFNLFTRIVRLVLSEKRQNAFLVNSVLSGNSDLQYLIHSRVLHIWDRSYSSPSHAGKRFFVVVIDYCVIVEHLKAPNYRDLLKNLKLPFVELSSGSIGADEPDAEKLLSPPDKRSVRVTALPDDVLSAADALRCKHCQQVFASRHAVYVKRRICPHCGEDLTAPDSVSVVGAGS